MGERRSEMGTTNGYQTTTRVSARSGYPTVGVMTVDKTDPTWERGPGDSGSKPEGRVFNSSRPDYKKRPRKFRAFSVSVQSPRLRPVPAWAARGSRPR